MTVTPSRRSLPMAGLVHSNRSPVTCHLRCADQCAQPIPNTSSNETFSDIAGQALRRRTVLGAALGLALVPAATGGRSSGAAAAAAAPAGSGNLAFTPIAPVAATVDTVTVPAGYRWQTVIRWGDPVEPGAKLFEADKQTGANQALTFGYNNDYTTVLTKSTQRAVLVCNHEYTNENIMFPPEMDPAEAIRVAWAAHGLSVVELHRDRKGQRWQYQRRARLNRRITLNTPFALTGPAAGSELLKTAADPTGRIVSGTMNNCSGGTTPWGTVLSGEENFHNYFHAAGVSATEKRYGLGANDSRNWRSLDPRWDATNPGYVNEPNRFGWVVEIDPDDPTSTPIKHTAMGRFKHEGANVIVAESGHVVAYMGDDERYEYLYKFVSKGTYDRRPGAAARRRNMTLLSDGDLYVARLKGDGTDDGVHDGTGQWLPLVKNGASQVPGMSVEEVLVFTRVAADLVQPTKMDRPEDVEPNLHNGKIYAACTNNSKRTPAEVDEANPRPANKDGHIVEITEDGGDHTGTTFTWDLLLVCGDPATAGTYFGGYTGPVSPISCPDNVAFDSEGNLWISTDGQPSSLKLADGLFKVPLSGPERGRVQQFLAVPHGAETCGPVIHDQDGSVFVAVQHPGEDGEFNAQQSYFPDYVSGTARPGQFKGPRPSIIQITKI